jgi:hypothetical protein
MSWSPADFVVDFLKPRAKTPARVGRVVAFCICYVLLLEFAPPNPEPFVFLAFPTFFWLLIATWNYFELAVHGE